MSKLLLLFGVVVVFTFTAGAQTSTSGSSDQSQTTQTERKTEMGQEQTITGCLASNGKFTLTTEEGTKYDISVEKVLKLAPYVGQEVKLTGRPVGGATPEFKASKVDHVSDTCKPGTAGVKNEAAPK